MMIAKKQKAKKTSTVGLLRVNLRDQLIGVLDIETLALSRDKRSVIYEVGMIITNILPTVGSVWTKKEVMYIKNLIELNDEDILRNGVVFETYSWHPSIVEQSLAGRIIDPDTIKWHQVRTAEKGIDFNQHLITTQRESAILVRDLHQQLTKAIKTRNIEQVWANHPQFDFGHLDSLWESCGILNTPTWSYKAECDIATAKTLYRNSLKNGEEDLTRNLKSDHDVHTGLGDCFYNLFVLAAVEAYPEASSINILL